MKKQKPNIKKLRAELPYYMRHRLEWWECSDSAGKIGLAPTPAEAYQAYLHSTIGYAFLKDGVEYATIGSPMSS